MNMVNSMINDLKKNGFEITTREAMETIDVLEDRELVRDMKKAGCGILLSNHSMACYWCFTDIPNMVAFFENGGKVSRSDAFTKIV